jgi:repressor LexA
MTRFELAEARETEALSYIKAYADENGYPPTIRGISLKMGLSIGGVQCVLARLVKQNKLSWEKSKSRTLRVLV